MKKEQIAELLYQALETEKGGVEIYETAVRCAVNEDLKEEWEKYLEQTERHVEVMEGLFETFGLDPETDTPGRLVVRHIGESLVRAMEMAMDAGNADAAQIVAAECIALAETKDHLNWQLMGQVAKKYNMRSKSLKVAGRWRRSSPGTRRRRSRPRTRRWRRKRTSTCTTPRAGAASSGLPRWACRRCCRRPRRRRT